MRRVSSSFVMLMVVSCGQFVSGAELNVPSQYATIQAAIDAASDGDTVLIAGGTYTGAGNRDLIFNGKAITVTSANGPDDCIIDCEGTEAEPHRGFHFNSGEDRTSVVEGLTITGGHAYHGGGISCWNNSSPTITGCKITGHSAEEVGGGIYLEGSSSLIDNCMITHNETTDANSNGGGIRLQSESYATVIGCTIIGNSSSGYSGGGISCDSSSPTILDCTIAANSADEHGGGGIGFFFCPSATVDNCTISGNSAEWGGGIWCCESSPTITGCTVSANTAEDEPGISCGWNTSPTIADCVISSNTAIWEAGGIYCNTDCSATIIGCIIANNSAGETGGAIECEESSPTISNCTIIGNSANESGGGIYCEDSSATITNCILWDNGDDLFDCTATYSCIQNGDAGTGNTAAYPHFVDPANGDYHLTSWSPCIDAGDDSAVSADQTDIDGDARILYDQVDIGADEAAIKSPDTDGDELPDDWEIENFGDLAATYEGNPDGDELTNADELERGTGPTKDNRVMHVSIANAGDPPADGSKEHPYSSIQQGIDDSTQTVLVAAGTYFERITVISKHLKIIGGYDADFSARDGGATIIDAEGGGTAAAFYSSGGRLEGLVISNGKAFLGGGIACHGSSPTIANCVIEGNLAQFGGGGILCVDGSSPAVTNCTVVNNSAAIGGGIGSRNASVPTITNCILWNNTSDLFGENATGYSCIQGGAPGEGNNNYLPRFADPANGDYHLLPTSPCINAGDASVISSSELDIDGQPRVRLGRVDMGAFEAGTRSLDIDGDGLPDDWEEEHFDDTAALSDDNPDGDELTNIDEYRRGTDPNVDRRNVYVSIANAGDPLADGTIAHPFENIQDGIDISTENVLVAEGIYVERIGLRSKALNLNGGYSADFQQRDPSAHETVIDGDQAGSVVSLWNSGGSLDGFTIRNGKLESGEPGGGVFCCDFSTTTVSRCTITNNTADEGGGLFCFISSPTINNCTISGNTAGDCGGGISCEWNSSPSITDCSISGNTAHWDGGGINCEESSPTIADCEIVDNTADNGAGGGIWCDESESSPTIDNCEVTGNTANWGGGIACEDDSSAEITNCSISGNTADNGGGISCHWCEESESSPTIDNCEITSNTGDFGSGVFCADSAGTISHCTVADNTSTGGSDICGIFCYSSSPAITGNTITGHADSGIACNESSSPAITNNTITGNGDGIRCWASSSPTIEGNEISDNDQDGVSGSSNGLVADNTITGNGRHGLSFGESSPVITGNTIASNGRHGLNCSNANPTIDGNTITGNAESGIYCSPCPEPFTISGNNITTNGLHGITLYNCAPSVVNNVLTGNKWTGLFCGNCPSFDVANNTITGNYQGGISSSSALPEIVNCILWANRNDLTRCTATYSCIEDGDSGQGNISADPLFVDPGHWDDGGTPVDGSDDTWIDGDYHIQAGSPCIDAGTQVDVDTDIEGNPRPTDWPGVDNNGGEPEFDMGAYEATPPVNGDINGDDCVNIADLLTVRNSLGQSGSDITPPEADINPPGDPDGVVNIADLLYVRNRLGNGSGCE